MGAIFDEHGWWPVAVSNATMFRDSKAINCTTLINPSNATIVFDVGWQAIPETIVFNLILFFFFLIIFVTLRRLAWDRKHVNIRRTSKGWLQSIYGDRKLAARAMINREDNPIIHHKHDIQIDILTPPLQSASTGDNLSNNNFRGSNTNVVTQQSNKRDQHIKLIGNEETVENINNNNHLSPVVTITQPLSRQQYVNLPTTEETSQNDSGASSALDGIVINARDSSPDQKQQQQPLQSGSDQAEGILGTSFDFANIPTNIQATFAEVGYKLSDVLLISNSDILKSRGNDALQYLLFQQYIIYFMAILSLFCMLVVLPVNLQGNEFDTSQGFARTTIINLPENSQFYWVHVIGVSVISLVGIFMMHRFSKVIKLDEEQITRRTLLIRRVPKDKRNKELIAAYFQKAIPSCIIEGIQSVYDVRGLSLLTNELTNLVNARCYCIEYLQLKGKRLKLRPSAFGEFGCLCGCCERCKKVDGIQYYTKQEEELQHLITTEMNKAVTHPTGGFFVTFETEKMAQEAFVHLRRKQERAFSFCSFSSTFTQISSWCQKCLNLQDDDELEVARWMVSYAPYPDDINWCDLTVNLRMQWFRSIAVSLLLLVIFVFISTPTVILNASDTLKLSNLIGWLQYFLPSELGSKVPELIGPFILVIAASTLPAIVTFACQHIAYANLSAKNHSIMWKVYLFLLLMVIIWPSLGLTSLKAFLLTMLSQHGQFPWNCLFPVKIGAFFVNYTIQYAFLGNIMELLRLPELLIYIWYKVTARSRAEVDTASRYVVWDFSIGIRYPRFLLIFAMVVTYSLSCPLITVAGLVYMLIKHLIDRYNIYYVYNPSKINSKIHSTAMIFVHIAFLMMQAQIFTVTLVRTGYSRVFGLALFVFLVSLLVFSGHFFFYMFRSINHLTYRATRKLIKARREYCACAYLPPVLYNLTRYTLNKSPSGANALSAASSSGVALNNANAGGVVHVASNGSGETGTCLDSIGSSQMLLVPTIDTSDAYFLSGSSRLSNGTRPRFSRHTTMLSTRNHKSRRTASDGQQQFHPSRLVKYEELQLKRTSSNLDNITLPD